MSSSTEIEAKFDTPRKWKRPAFGDLVARKVPTTNLVAVYWDTPDRRLDEQGVTLRRRTADDGAPAEWTVKLPLRSTGGVHHRQEVNVDGVDEAPPAELRSLLTAMSRGDELVPIAELHTERRRRHLGNDVWADAVELTDDRVTSVVAGRPGPTFRQVEVELLDHAAGEVMASVLDTLRDSGLTPSTDASKLRRVLRAAVVSDEREVSDASTIGGLIATSLGRGLSGMVRADPWIRLGDDDEAVHRCRKTLRRLRSDLKALRPVLDRDRTEALRDELKWYAGLLGTVRDLHVMRDHLLDLAEAAGIPAEELDPILEILESQLTVERGHLRSAMDGDRYVALLDTVSELRDHVPLRTGVDPDGASKVALAGAGRKAWKQTRRARRRARKEPTTENLHTVRKKAKYARATAQLAKDAGADSKKFVRAAGALKDELGDLHDGDVIAAWLDGLPHRHDPGAAYVAGRLRERAAGERSELEATWPDVWDDLDRPRLRKWIS